MVNSFGVPGISVQEFAQKIADGDDMLLLDIREEPERHLAKMDEALPAVEHLPLSQFDPAAVPEFLRENLLAPGTELVIMCHHGIRSAQFTYWLLAQGYENILNLDGGIEAWAVEIDPQVGRY
ncbi:MAG: rhodanese-like domain-containing protein [Candidatus Promineifilaceae bacterium]|nr:rhodanese-like domain-containing protein [Candidatus Promineifilaceae bacterium]